MKLKSFAIIGMIAFPLAASLPAMAEANKAAAKPSALVSLACSVMTGPGQATISASVSRGVPLPTSGNCSDDVIGYLNIGFRIKATLSSGTGALIYILVK